MATRHQPFLRRLALNGRNLAMDVAHTCRKSQRTRKSSIKCILAIVSTSAHSLVHRLQLFSRVLGARACAKTFQFLSVIRCALEKVVAEATWMQLHTNEFHQFL